MGKVRLCRGLETAFLSAADSMPDDRKKSLREQVQAFDVRFYPILASKEYRDWKQDDVALVESIPFVLTYTEQACMAIPFSADDNTGVFGNVAAPTVVSPYRIIYLYRIAKKDDLDKLLDVIPQVMQFMSKKQFRAAVELVLACEKKAQDFVGERAEEEIKELGGGRIRQVKRIVSDDARAIPADIGAYLRQRSRSAGKRFFAVEKNDTKLSEMLLVAGFYDAFPSYRFDSRSMEFDDMVGCDMLRYIRKKPYMTVSDMMSLRRSAGDSGNRPEFFEDNYGELWGKYKENPLSWKCLCKALKDYADKNDIIARFKTGQSKKNTYCYTIPFECSRSAEKIIQFLAKHEVIGRDSCVEGHTTDSCQVTISGACGCNKEEFDRLFSKVYALMIADDIEVYLKQKDHEVDVKFHSLEVSDAPIDERQRDLMDYFGKKGYVLNCQFAQDEDNEEEKNDKEGKNKKVRVSFTYASRQMRGLLTSEGKMLEVHTYRKVKELGEFDDVVSGYEISWGDTEVKNEFDCVLTKGFRSLFVECKARPNIDQNFYYKLRELTERFGINATPVLVADTEEDSAPLNDMQRDRGNMLDVITVYKRREIDDIGNTLLRIIDGNYGNKDKNKEERDHG